MQTPFHSQSYHIELMKEKKNRARPFTPFTYQQVSEFGPSETQIKEELGEPSLLYIVLHKRMPSDSSVLKAHCKSSYLHQVSDLPPSAGAAPAAAGDSLFQLK